MKALQELYILVKSLGIGELRAVRSLINSAKSQKSNSEALLEALVTTKKYQAEEIKKKISTNDTLRKFLSAEINYLRPIIIKGVRIYQEKNATISLIHSSLQEDAILEDRGLTRLRVKGLEKAESLANEVEVFDSLLEISDRKLLLSFRNGANPKEVEAEIEKYGQRIKEFSDYKNLRLLQHRLFHLYRSKPSINSQSFKAKLNSYSKSPLIKEPPTTTSFRIMDNWLGCKVLIATMEDNTQESFRLRKEQIDLWDSNPKYKAEKHKTYYAALYNYILSSFMADDFSNAAELLEKLDLNKGNSISLEAIHFSNFMHLKLLWIMNTQPEAKIGELIKDIHKGIAKHKAHLSVARQKAFYANIAIALFSRRKFEQTIDVLQQIFDLKKEERLDIYMGACILEIVCYLSLPTYNNLAESRIINLQRRVNRMKTEDVLLSKLLSALSVVQKSGVEKQAILTLKTTLESPKMKSLILRNELISWCDFML